MTNTAKTLAAVLIAAMAAVAGAGAAIAHGDSEADGPRAETAGLFVGGKNRGHGARGGMMREIMSQIDADDSRSISQAEVDDFRAAKVRGADASGDGNLSLDEFEALFAEMNRGRMVDVFQHLDDDGDGLITAKEMDDRFGGIVARMDRDGDGELSLEDRRGRGRGHGHDH